MCCSRVDTSCIAPQAMVSWCGETDVPLDGWPWFCRCAMAASRRAERTGLKTFVSKLRPTTAQAAWLAETLATCRRLSNHALSERKTAYRNGGESIGVARPRTSLSMLKRTWESLLRVHSQVARDVLRRGDRAFQAFVRRATAAKRQCIRAAKGEGCNGARSVASRFQTARLAVRWHSCP